MYSFDKLDNCPVCKLATPHDSGMMGGQMVCKVCGVVRMESAVGAFRKCMDCDQWIPTKPQIAIDVLHDRVVAPPIPEHKCSRR